MTHQRELDAEVIRTWYDNAIRSLENANNVFKTSSVKGYLWAAEHKRATLGLCATLRILRNSVPYADSREDV